MIGFLISSLAILFTIFFIIGIHETAHFIAARLLGIKVLRFSIGFGKILFRYHDQKGTEYILSLIPLGGYVKMLDENEENVPADQKIYAFNHQPFYKKSLVILAGPLSNLVSAFFLYWLLFVIGFYSIKPIIGEVIPHSIAAKAGLSTQYEIISLDNRPTPDWHTILLRLLPHLGNQEKLALSAKNVITHQSRDYTLDLSHWKIDALMPDLLISLGIKPFTPSVPLIVGDIKTNSPALSANLRKGDKIIAINEIKIATWDEFMSYIQTHPNQESQFTIQRDHVLMNMPITIGEKRTITFKKIGFLGISPPLTSYPHLLNHIKYTPLIALSFAQQKLLDYIYLNFLTLKKLLTGKLSVQSLGGPITIFGTAGQALNNGLLTFINFLAFLSISIGIINLLPIPGLDGGVFFLYLIESIIKKPLPPPLLEILYKLGFFILLLILVQSLINDILRL